MGLVNRLTSDATLVRRALADTPAAFEALVERYQRQTAAIARALGVPKSSVDDVVQESLLGVLGSPQPALAGGLRTVAPRHRQEPFTFPSGPRHVPSRTASGSSR